ncbi:MAG: hypothetical protein QOJ30_6409 [Pseudonocardiales bacterium]|nr:hypothetical protein [Pseudonocardiales bacterium]
MTSPSAVRPSGRPGLALRVEPVIEAARGAPNPTGPVRWFIRAVEDGIELRTVVRRWSVADELSARTVRVSGGAALRNARLAVAVQGRRPLLTFPPEAGLLAVLRAGASAAPQGEERLLYAVLSAGARETAGTSPAAHDVAVRTLLRRAAEAEACWLRELPERPAGLARDSTWPAAAVGPASRTGALVVLLGAEGPGPAADLRLGQALQSVRLTSMALGLRPEVRAAPVPVGVLPHSLRPRLPSGGSLAVLELSPG